MEWFFERVGSDGRGASYSYQERAEHKYEFNKLKALSLIQHSDNLAEIPCPFCEEEHLVKPMADPAKEGAFIVMCGSAMRDVDEDELRYVSLNWQKLLERIQTDLQVTTTRTPDDVSRNQDGSLWTLGTYTDHTPPVDLYYLPTNNTDEWERYVLDIPQVRHKANLVLTSMPVRARKATQAQFVALSEVSADLKDQKHLLDQERFEKEQEAFRRIFFDKKNGGLLLDGDLVYTASDEKEEWYFLEYLWDNFGIPTSQHDVYQYVLQQTGKSTSKTEQNYIAHIKSKIKEKFADADKVITSPATGKIMLADPVGEKSEI